MDFNPGDPMNPMPRPDEMAEPGMPYGPPLPDPLPGYEAVPVEPTDLMNDDSASHLEIQAAIQEAQAGPVSPVEQDLYLVPGLETVAEPMTDLDASIPIDQGPNPYGAPQEHWEFPDIATGAGPVTAITSSRETFIEAPEEGLTIRQIEPHGDELLLNPDVRREFTPQIPDHLLSLDELEEKYGRRFTNKDLPMIRQASLCHWNTPTPEVPDRQLSDQILRRKYGQDMTDQELARIREVDRREKAQEIRDLLGQVSDWLGRARRP